MPPCSQGMACSKSQRRAARRQGRHVHSASRISARCRSRPPGSWARVWCRWSQSVTAIGSRSKISSGPSGLKPRQPGPQPPDPVVARRPHVACLGVRSPGLSHARVSGGDRPGAAVREGVAVRVGDGQAPAGRRVGGRPAGHVAGQGGVDGAEAAGFAGMVGQAEEAGQGNAQVDPGGQRTGRPGAGPAGGARGLAVFLKLAGLPFPPGCHRRRTCRS